jgi:hypothetical protein
LQQGEGNQPNDRCYSDQQRVANLPAKQHDETANRDQHGEPIANGDLTQQHTSSQNRADGSTIRALDESLDVRVLSMSNENRGDKQDEQEGWQKDTDRSHQRSPEGMNEGSTRLRQG